MVAYTAETEDLRVTVQPAWVPAQTDALAGTFVFVYRIRLENGSTGDVQVLRRSWRIVHADGRVETVEGVGVVGEQPVLPPGGSYVYTSFVVLSTFTGTMEGFYTMQRESGERFRVAIPRFPLAAMAN
ncbi:MAG: Co2+/Mg2+ efflux protein ApaG [Rhodothermales bacterium]|nr:Co2+/Mg2+ efflux protein ApaG [Rhodothermales bacterium]